MVISVMSCRFQNTICGCLDILEVQTLLVLPCLHYSQTFLQSVQLLSRETLLSKEKHSCQEKHSCNISCRTIQFPRHLLHSPFPSRPGNSIIHTNSPLSFCITVCVCLNLLKFQQGFKLVPSKSIQLQQTSTSLLFFFPPTPPTVSPSQTGNWQTGNWQTANLPPSPSSWNAHTLRPIPPRPTFPLVRAPTRSPNYGRNKRRRLRAVRGVRVRPSRQNTVTEAAQGEGGGSLYPF